MSELEHGAVMSVAEIVTGDELAVAASAGALILELVDAVDFTESGGVLKIGDEIIGYSSADLDSDFVQLDTATTLAYDAGEPVLVQPDARERVATVQLDDDGEAIEARVPHALYDRIDEGIRDVPEHVSLDLDGGTWVIVDVIGREPVIDGSYIDETTLPTPELSDGAPPPSSPTPTMLGGVGVLHVRWPGVVNADAVTYEVHLSQQDGFTPDSTTLAAETASTAVTLKTLPNGTALSYGPEDAPTTYHVKLIAKDVDGAAAPSAQTSSSLYRITNEEVSALFAYFGAVSADQLTAGDIDAAVTVSGEVKTSEQGQRVVMDSQGLHLFDSAQQPIVDLPTDPTKPADFKGNAEMRQLTVTQSLAIQTAGTLNSGAGFELMGGTVAPTVAPSVALDHEVGATPYQPTNPDLLVSGGNASVYGVGFDATYSYLLTGSTSTDAGPRYRLQRLPLDGGTASLSVALMSGYVPKGMDRDSADGSLWVWLYHSGTGAHQLAKHSGTTLAYANVVHDFTASTNKAKGVSIHNGVAYCAYINGADSKLTIAAVTLATGAQTTYRSSAAIAAADQGTGNGIAVGTFDYSDSTLRFVFNTGTHARVYSISSGTTLTERTSDTFAIGSDGGVGSGDIICWTGSEFRQVLRTQVGFEAGAETFDIPWKRFTGVQWTTESSTWWASYAWRNGTYLTEQGRRTQFTMLRRYRVRVTSASIPTGGAADPAAVTFYLGRSSTEPARTAMWQNGGTPANGVTSVLLTSVVFSGTNPAATNNFPGSAPGYIKSTAKRSNGTDAQTYFDGAGVARADGLIPPGTVLMWAGATAPSGWAICDGTTKSRTLDKPLFDVISTTFGAGDGSTTFNLPNLGGRFPIGAGVKTRGSVGGSETSTIAQSNLPRHVHDMTHTHEQIARRTTTGTGTGAARGGGTDQPDMSSGPSSQGATGDGSFNNDPLSVLNPYLALHFIIKL